MEINNEIREKREKFARFSVFEAKISQKSPAQASG